MISLSGITKVFDSRGIAGLHSVDLDIKDNEIFSILGPNGSGKTTLLKVIHGEIKPEEGQIKLKGKTHLFSPIAPEQDKNVLTYLTSLVTLDLDADKKILLARDLADIFEFTFQLRQNFSQLSAGQKQKVLVASELMNRPENLLLDEPFSHLDPFTRQGILTSLFGYLRQQKISVLWVTHDLQEALFFSDRIGVMNFGKWEQIGTPDEVIHSPRNIFTAQFMGHKNFLTVKYDQGWVTPWGELKSPEVLKNEAILILSSHWDLVADGTQMKIKKRWPTSEGENFILEFQEREFHAIFPLTKIPEHSTSITVSARLNESFLIPL